MKKFTDSLTNEILSGKFGSQFEMVRYSIERAKNMIRSGRGPYVKTDSRNVASQILSEIAVGADQFEDIEEEDIPYEDVMAPAREFMDYASIDKENIRAGSGKKSHYGSE
jgi:hypothetical protein